MAPNFTQPTTTASANGGVGRDAAINNRAAINEKSSALAKMGGGRRRRSRSRSGRRSRKSRKTRRTTRRTTRTNKRRIRRRKTYGGGTEGPMIKGPSAEVANKLAIAQMAGAENAKNDAKV